MIGPERPLSVYAEEYSSTGEALVLIHGWACSMQDWDPIPSRVLNRFRVIAVDLPGHGRSPDRSDAFDVFSIADEVAGALRLRGVTNAIIIGHSAGAEVSVALAVNHPDLVRAVVGVDPGYGLPVERRHELRQVADRLHEGDIGGVVGDYFRMLDDLPSVPRDVAVRHQVTAANAREGAARLFEEFTFAPGAFHFLPDTMRFHRKRAQPLLGLYRNDERADVGRGFVVGPHDKVISYTDSGHWPHHDRPETVWSDALEWISALPSVTR